MYSSSKNISDTKKNVHSEENKLAKIDSNGSQEFQENNYSYKKFKRKPKSKIYCGNCGRHGHMYKYCREPITSFGVILVSIDGGRKNDKDTEFVNNNLIDTYTSNSGISMDEQLKINASGIKYQDNTDIETFCKFKNSIKFLMIRRKHTLGYIEFIRGRYNIKNVDGIIFLFRQMTPIEIERISRSSFDELWNELWSGNKSKNSYYNEYIQSKQKFEKLKNDNESECYLGLDFYVDKVVPTWDYAEWGFPKGRRNYQETNLSCATREFEEESGFVDDDYKLFSKLLSIDEQFIGTNGINYRHIYYPAISITDKVPTIDPDNKNQANEIGDIGWFTYEEAINLIRPYHTERKRLLTELYMYLINNIIEMYRDKN